MIHAMIAVTVCSLMGFIPLVVAQGFAAILRRWSA